MATKVDRTASMLCRRHGCSSEKITERMLEAEARVAELEAALWLTVPCLDEAHSTTRSIRAHVMQVLEKGKGNDD